MLCFSLGSRVRGNDGGACGNDGGVLVVFGHPLRALGPHASPSSPPARGRGLTVLRCFCWVSRVCVEMACFVFVPASAGIGWLAGMTEGVRE